MSGSELVSMLAEEAVVTLYMTIFSTAVSYTHLDVYKRQMDGRRPGIVFG